MRRMTKENAAPGKTVDAPTKASDTPSKKSDASSTEGDAPSNAPGKWQDSFVLLAKRASTRGVCAQGAFYDQKYRATCSSQGVIMRAKQLFGESCRVCPALARGTRLCLLYYRKVAVKKWM